jgi:Regulator of chromosome condensation (RCC1) repeat
MAQKHKHKIKIRLFLLLTSLLAVGLACSEMGIPGLSNPTESQQPVDTESMNSTAMPVLTQISAFETSNFTAITAGGDHTCALLANGGVKCWGG